jgi:queuosine precursor transporter
MLLDTRNKLFLTLAGIFITALLVGDLIGAKLTSAPLVGLLSVGIIPFPITFVLTDLLNEFYGKQAARTVTWVGFFMTLFCFAILTIALAVPWAPETTAADWQGLTQPHFDAVFGGSRRILFASLVAYLTSQFVDIAVFHALRQRTEGRMLWLRATGSTLVSQLIDTALIQSLAWWGVLPATKIFELILSSYLVKVLVAVGLTPVIYAGHGFVERVLKVPPYRA